MPRMWRSDIDNVVPNCTVGGCGSEALIRMFIFTGDGSFVGLNICPKCQKHSHGHLPPSAIISMILASKDMGIITPADVLCEEDEPGTPDNPWFP